jgi:hypothetical protein
MSRCEDPVTEPKSTPAVPAEVLAAHLEGEAVLLHMESKSYFRLNETAARVFRGLERGLARDAIVDDLCSAYEVGRDEAESAVDTLLADLAARGLVTPSGGGGQA